jgi:hypothetical protein
LIGAVSVGATLALVAALAAVPQDLAPPPEEEEEANPLIVAGTSTAIVAIIAAWGWGAWWNEGFKTFHFRETGFLGHETYAGGADKLGHMYGTYLSAKATTKLYLALGMRQTGAALLSAGAVTLVSNGIELADGFTSFGFEYGDVVFNTLGTIAALASDLSPEFHAMFGMRIAYVPSRDFLANEKTFIKWINDYTGMLFYLDLKLKGVFEAFGEDPGLARYLITGVVWGSERYSPVRVESERRRSLGVHVGVSLPQILRDVYEGDQGVEAFATFFDYYAVPFLSVALINDLNSGEWILNFGVANRLEIDL